MTVCRSLVIASAFLFLFGGHAFAEEVCEEIEAGDRIEIVCMEVFSCDDPGLTPEQLMECDGFCSDPRFQDSPQCLGLVECQPNERRVGNECIAEGPPPDPLPDPPRPRPPFGNTPAMISPTGQGLRGTDSYGSGTFGSPRLRDDGEQDFHKGADFISVAGQEVVSPVNGKIVRIIRRVYKGDDRYQGIEIRTPDRFRIKLFYVASDPSVVGTEVRAGDMIGTAQDLTVKYPTTDTRQAITNHIHVEVRASNGRTTDPGQIFNVLP